MYSLASVVSPKLKSNIADFFCSLLLACSVNSTENDNEVILNLELLNKIIEFLNNQSKSDICDKDAESQFLSLVKKGKINHSEIASLFLKLPNNKADLRYLVQQRFIQEFLNIIITNIVEEVSGNPDSLLVLQPANMINFKDELKNSEQKVLDSLRGEVKSQFLITANNPVAFFQSSSVDNTSQTRSAEEITTTQAITRPRSSTQ